MLNTQQKVALNRVVAPLITFGICLFQFFVASQAYASAKDLTDIKTIVVIYAENRSFDNLYGLFPGANGVLKNSDGSPTGFELFKQRDRDGVTLLPKLPSVWNSIGTPSENKLRFVSELPNQPFRIDAPPGAPNLKKASKR